MTSRLVTAMDDIATVVEALTPPSDTTVRYRRLRNPENAARRSFYFTLARAAADMEFGSSFRLVRYDLQLVVRLDITGRDLTTLAEDRANEGALLEGAVQFHGAWSTGVRAVTVTGSDYQPTDSGDVELTIGLTVLAEETDGS